MRGLAVAGLLLSGCSFFLGDGDSPAQDPSADGGQNIDAGVSTDARSVSPADTCPEEMGLAACYLFDGDLIDGSTNANNVTTAVGVDFANGLAGQAAVFSNNDRATVGENGDSLDMFDLTIEVWVRPATFAAAGDRRGIFDSNSEYSLFIDENGQVECNGAGGLPASGQLRVGGWSHVACVIDANSSITLYIDGEQVATDTATTLSQGINTVEIASDSPYAVDDSHYIGMLDNLLIWNVPRTRVEICQTAGLSCD